MRYYEQKFPRWKEILHILHWYLKMRLKDAAYAVERGNPIHKQQALQHLQESYQNSRFLHCFLGYRSLNKLEREVQTFLESHQSLLQESQSPS